jgi:hypothetical protein
MDGSHHFADVILVVSCGIWIVTYWKDALWSGHNCCEGGQSILLFESLGFQRGRLRHDRIYHLNPLHILTDSLGVEMLAFTLDFFFGRFQLLLYVFQFILESCFSLYLSYDTDFIHKHRSAVLLLHG